MTHYHVVVSVFASHSNLSIIVGFIYLLRFECQGLNNNVEKINYERFSSLAVLSTSSGYQTVYQESDTIIKLINVPARTVLCCVFSYNFKTVTCGFHRFIFI